MKDVLVIGGGPAGSSCALKLARFGMDVLLLGKSDEKRQHVGESLPSSIRVVLGALGLELPRDVVASRPPSHLVFWGSMRGGRPWTGVPPEESSLLVWRGPFDRFLRERAAEGGVAVIEDAVKRVRRRRGGVEVETSGGGTHRARFVVDASGRSGVLARSHRRREPYRTLALTGHFRTGEPSPPTLVEAFEDGWVWSAPLANGLRDVTVMLEPRAMPAGREALFASALERAENAAKLLSGGGAAEGPIRGTDATPYESARYCGEDFLLVGDAASFLDPLSAHGLHKAMDGALAAAVVARSILERPARAEDAREFYDERERNIYRVTTDRLRGLYGQETRWASRPFWKRRSGGPLAAEPPAARPRPPLHPQAILRASPSVTVTEAPVLEGDFIERREVLVAPGRERPVRFHGPVSLPDLYKEVVSSPSASEAARRSPFGFERAFAAIEWLYRSGYLEERSRAEL